MGYAGAPGSTSNVICMLHDVCWRNRYSCPAGSTTATPAASICATGRYSTGGAMFCTQCPAGSYGSTTGLTTSACTGLCSAGRYGSNTGLTAAACDGSCSAGRYGDVAGQTTNQCVGSCPAGYFCPAGTISPTTNICPTGRFSTGGSGNSCSSCAAGLYGATTGLMTTGCTGPCQAGYYGSSNRQTTPTCNGPCSGGYYGDVTGLMIATCVAMCTAG